MNEDVSAFAYMNRREAQSLLGFAIKGFLFVGRRMA